MAENKPYTMKKTLLFGAILCSYFSFGQIIQENFDDYEVGDYASEVSAVISTWSGSSGGSDDTFLTDTQAYSAPLSMELFSTDVANGGPADIFVPMGYSEEGYDVNFYLYVAEGSGGYYNIQTSLTVGTGWAYDVFFYPDGTVELSLNQVAQPNTGTYTNGAWVLVENHIDLVNDIATVSVDGVEMFSTIFISDLGGINFYALGTEGAAGHYFVDDFEVTQFTPQNISDLSVNDALIYPIPSSSDLTITQLPFGSNVQIFDMLGKLTYQEVTYSGMEKIDVSEWNKGIYFVKILQGNLETTRKIIVE